jgi:hypothetical protein
VVIPLLRKFAIFVTYDAAIHDFLGWGFFRGVVERVGMAVDAVGFVGIIAGGGFLAPMDAFLVLIVDGFVGERFAGGGVLDRMALRIAGYSLLDRFVRQFCNISMAVATGYIAVYGL